MDQDVSQRTLCAYACYMHNMSLGEEDRSRFLWHPSLPYIMGEGDLGFHFLCWHRSICPREATSECRCSSRIGRH